MASHVFTPALARLVSASLNDLRVMLLMTNTTADTEVDADTLDEITTHDEMDGSGYAIEALTSEAVNVDTGNDRAEVDADDATFAAMSNGTRQIQGWLLYQHIDGTDANDQAVMYADFSGNINPGGSALTITFDSEGIIQIANA